MTYTTYILPDLAKYTRFLVSLLNDGITIRQLKSASRKREIAEKRHLLMYLMIASGHYSITQAGSEFNRDKATCIYAVNLIEGLSFTDQNFRQKIIQYLETMEKHEVEKNEIIRFNTILHKLNLTDMKRDYIFEATQGRTSRTKEMYPEELRNLNRQLTSVMQSHESFTAGNVKRKRILSICYQLPDRLGFTKFDHQDNKTIVDLERLNQFLTGPKSIYKKKLNYHTPEELSHVIVQFENMLKGYLKSN